MSAEKIGKQAIIKLGKNRFSVKAAYDKNLINFLKEEGGIYEAKWQEWMLPIKAYYKIVSFFKANDYRHSEEILTNKASLDNNSKILTLSFEQFLPADVFARFKLIEGVVYDRKISRLTYPLEMIEDVITVLKSEKIAYVLTMTDYGCAEKDEEVTFLKSISIQQSVNPKENQYSKVAKKTQEANTSNLIKK